MTSAQIRQNDWKQGSNAPRSMLAQPKCEGYMVVSHDCDIVCPSFEKEPFVELLGFEMHHGRSNPQFRHGKNPRRLHIELGTSNYVEFNVTDREFLDRQKLATNSPLANILNSKQLDGVKRWLGKRYTRSAFPDAFNNRMKAAQKGLKKLWKRDVAHGVSGVYLMLSPQCECDPSQTYKLSLRLTVQDADILDDATELAESVQWAITECCEGITVTADAVCEDDFTLADLRLFQRWDWDYLSYSGAPAGVDAATPVDG